MSLALTLLQNDVAPANERMPSWMVLVLAVLVFMVRVVDRHTCGTPQTKKECARHIAIETG